MELLKGTARSVQDHSEQNVSGSVRFLFPHWGLALFLVQPIPPNSPGFSPPGRQSGHMKSGHGPAVPPEEWSQIPPRSAVKTTCRPVFAAAVDLEAVSAIVGQLRAQWVRRAKSQYRTSHSPFALTETKINFLKAPKGAVANTV
ncbi:hypothetical protein VDGL01_09519 [Verticillium dahliae]